METYLVFGADGPQGRAVVEGLLDVGVPRGLVIGTVRHTHGRECAELSRAGVCVVRANLRRPKSIAAALDACAPTRVYFTTDFFSKLCGTVEREVATGLRVVEACEFAESVEMICYGSTCDCDRAPSRVAHFRAKLALERLLARGAKDFCVVRSAQLLDALETRPPRGGRPGEVRFLTHPETSVQYASLLDVGRAAAHCLTHPDVYAGRTVDVATCAHTGPELARLLSLATGAPYAYGEMMPRIAMKMLMPEVYFMTKFLEKKGGHTADIDACRERFPNLLDAERWFARKDAWPQRRDAQRSGQVLKSGATTQRDSIVLGEMFLLDYREANDAPPPPSSSPTPPLGESPTFDPRASFRGAYLSRGASHSPPLSSRSTLSSSTTTTAASFWTARTSTASPPQSGWTTPRLSQRRSRAQSDDDASEAASSVAGDRGVPAFPAAAATSPVPSPIVPRRKIASSSGGEPVRLPAGRGAVNGHAKAVNVAFIAARQIRRKRRAGVALATAEEDAHDLPRTSL